MMPLNQTGEQRKAGSDINLAIPSVGEAIHYPNYPRIQPCIAMMLQHLHLQLWQRVAWPKTLKGKTISAS